MFLTITGPAGHKEERSLDTQGAALGVIFRDHRDDVAACLINGRLWDGDRWERFIPRQGDRIELIVKTEDFGISAILSAIISAIISSAINAIVRALTPGPKAPKLDSKRHESFGIAGFNNTTGPGTPRFVPYGLNRIHGHVIASGADLAEDGRSMLGRVLYFMGDTGGDQVQSIGEVLIDDVTADQYEGLEIHTRLGADAQAVIPEFENVDQLHYDGRPLPYDTTTETGTPIVYTTDSDSVERSSLFFVFAGGLYRIDPEEGAKVNSRATFKIETKLNSDPPSAYAEVAGSPITYKEKINSDLYKKFVIDHGSANKWDIRITMTFRPKGTSNVVSPSLFNVQETEFTALNYGGDALLALTKIPAKQVRSLESMRVSALVEGKRVKIPDGAGNTNLLYTRQRCWIVRDMMTHPLVGMGNEIEEEEINDDQWIGEQDYYDELVTGHNGDEPRDLCDVVTNESRWDWDWIKSVAGEGRGRIIPSGAKWNYVIDRPGSPNLLYAEGANIIENSVLFENAPLDRPFNQVIAEFRDADDDYRPAIPEPINDPDIGSDPIVQTQLKYETFTRESQVQRENMIYLKKAKLERRRWTFKSPTNGIVSEPMDLDYFAERSLGNKEDGVAIGPYSGLLPAGSTTTTVLLPFAVFLQAAETYELIVGHAADNTVETRTISTGNGTWHQVTVSSPFVQAPAERDYFILGIENVERIVTRCQDVEWDAEGRVKQLRTEYIPEVFTAEALPPKSERRFFKLQRLPPLSLRDAQVIEEIVLARDGSYRSVVSFGVTPGLVKHGGIAQGGATDHITLASIEPNGENYFRGAILRTLAGTGSGQERTIVSYDSARQAFVSAPFSPAPNATTSYEIEWTRFGEYAGFKVEVSDEATGDFALVGQPLGTTWEIDGRGQRGTFFYRFTPYAANGIENLVARIIRQITLTGDTVAPAAPSSVTLSVYLKNVTVGIFQPRPTAEDLAGYILHFYLAGTGGVLNTTTDWTFLREVRIPVTRDDSSTGTMLRRHVEIFHDRNYGDLIFVFVASYDFSDNRSAFFATQSGPVELTEVDTNDVTPGAITATEAFTNDAELQLDANTELASITVDSDGGVINLFAKCEYEATGVINDALQIELRRDSMTGTILDFLHISQDNFPSSALVPIFLMAVEQRAPGTYVYKLVATIGGDQNDKVRYRKLTAIEMKR